MKELDDRASQSFRTLEALKSIESETYKAEYHKLRKDYYESLKRIGQEHLFIHEDE